MLKILIVFFTGFLGSLIPFPTHLHAKTLDREQSSQTVSIIVVDQYTPVKNEVINELLALQQSLVIPVQIPIPEHNVQNGYLLIQMTPEYVNNLLEQKHGTIVAAYQEQSLVGYILLIDISEFKELYEDPAIGHIETTIDRVTLESLLSQPHIGYIEQIGVKSNCSRKGIGTKLIDASKKLKPNGLVADIFLEPLKNEASLQFFKSQGFEKTGILHQHPRKDFPYEHQTQVFFWNLIQSPHDDEKCSSKCAKEIVY